MLASVPLSMATRTSTLHAISNLLYLNAPATLIQKKKKSHRDNDNGGYGSSATDGEFNALRGSHEWVPRATPANSHDNLSFGEKAIVLRGFLHFFIFLPLLQAAVN